MFSSLWYLLYMKIHKLLFKILIINDQKRKGGKLQSSVCIDLLSRKLSKWMNTKYFFCDNFDSDALKGVVHTVPTKI